MIQIDMPMPEKCSDCIFCTDYCSCVASDYNGIGINVGCAYRTGRRDIRCPLKEQQYCNYCGTVFDVAYKAGKADAVVRCKDCKKRESWECWQYFFGRIKIPDDWFCADGEQNPTQTNAKKCVDGRSVKWE